MENIAPSKPKRIQNSLLVDIALGDYVLIIGDDVILRDDYHEGNLEHLIKSKIEEEENSGNFYEDDTETYKRTHVLRECINYSESNVNPDLIKIIKSKCFPVVITTSVTPYIENLMRSTWGKNLTVRSIFSREKEVNMDDAYEFGTKPVLYYAFGNCYDDIFVLNEYDMMTALSNWINEASPKNFKRYVWSKMLMSIGCTFEDWYFRFLWFTMTGAIEQEKRLRHGNVALTLGAEQEPKLRRYLERKARVNTKYNAREALRELASLIGIRDGDNGELIDNSHNNCENQRYLSIIRNRRVGGVFISYAHEDYEFAEQLFYKLKSNNLDVWLDSKNLPYADNVGYPERVSNALRQASVFIPILSNQTIKDMTEGNKRCYIEDEWTKISPESKIAPVCIEDYIAGTNSYHEKVKHTIPSFNDKVGQVFYAKSESFRKFIEDLKR